MKSGVLLIHGIHFYSNADSPRTSYLSHKVLDVIEMLPYSDPKIINRELMASCQRMNASRLCSSSRL